MALKTHQSYQNQVALLKERGLSYVSHEQVMHVLKNIGYYRLSGYTYPLREPVTDARGRIASRLDFFQPNATFEHAVELYEFDQRLRLLLQDALEVIEVAFCAQVGYVLGRRSPDAHLKPSELDAEFCATKNRSGQPRHEDWVRRYEKLKKQARNEDYVKHHLNAYEDNFPIWVATEFMDFGSIVSLFEMMKKDDQIEIAQTFGLKNDQAGIMHSWMLALNDLRNRCAHNNRVWNRVSRLPRKPNTAMTTTEFHHFNELTESQHSNLYGAVAVVAYLVRNLDPKSLWPNRAKHEFESFGEVFGMTLENTMGFPAGWQNEALWQ
jgi:abortive infection bacteriophage resistance protein